MLEATGIGKNPIQTTHNKHRYWQKPYTDNTQQTQLCKRTNGSKIRTTNLFQKSRFANQNTWTNYPWRARKNTYSNKFKVTRVNI